MNWRERKDMPWLIGAAIAVLVAIIGYFVWNGISP
jgi:hypothetical protein